MFVYPKQYDVIVVGAGHAGVEAALASARMGCETLLLSINLDGIGQMSCNPAIGGLAKGHLAREIDALGGEMGRATDMTGLQFRMLNTKKGPSVRAPRAQCDKKAYQFWMKWVCEREENLDVKQGQATRLLHEDNRILGVEITLGVQYLAKSVVVTTGTFLRGLLHVGRNQQAGGRAGEGAAMGLSDSLVAVGLELGRLKTGTPPRLSRRSIDFGKAEIQPGDHPVPYFSFWTDELFHVEHTGEESRQMFHVEQTQDTQSTSPYPSPYPPGSILARINGQLPCWVTYTTNSTAAVIKDNLHLSPLYSGTIEGVGPRYCPSIEDKIVKFPEKERHQIFLEPEGIATEEIYVNGFSTSLPYSVQIDLVKTIIGCERAEILRPAYAVEYDFSFPTQLLPSLETKACANLFLAGQINGTSGYEEAAAQGLIAGINAARKTRGMLPLVLRRDQAYIGVLIDDLVTKGTIEPYRMFTSRAEYRLTLRQDNADLRLSSIGFEVGLLSSGRHQKVLERKRQIESEINRLRASRVGNHSALELLRRPEVTYAELPCSNPHLAGNVRDQVEIQTKYEGYISRQDIEINQFRSMEEKLIPDWLDYTKIPSLRTEARQKLVRIKPGTLGQASRISGVSPADLALVMVWMKRGKKD